LKEVEVLVLRVVASVTSCGTCMDITGGFQGDLFRFVVLAVINCQFRTVSDKGTKTIRYRRSLNRKLCRLGIGRCSFSDSLGTLREIKVFGFWGLPGPDIVRIDRLRALS